MKRFNLSNVIGAGVLALSLSILPSALPANAQSDNAPNTTTAGANEGDRDFDWGWLGLLGLAGLAGLARKTEDPVRLRSTDEAGTTRY